MHSHFNSFLNANKKWMEWVGGNKSLYSSIHTTGNAPISTGPGRGLACTNQLDPSSLLQECFLLRIFFFSELSISLLTEVNESRGMRV